MATVAKPKTANTVTLSVHSPGQPPRSVTLDETTAANADAMPGDALATGPDAPLLEQEPLNAAETAPSASVQPQSVGALAGGAVLQSLDGSESDDAFVGLTPDVVQQDCPKFAKLAEMEAELVKVTKRAKSLKEEIDLVKCELLNSYACALMPYRKMPLFEAADKAKAEEAPTDPDAWRSVLLTATDLPEKYHGRLRENQILTVGDLEEARASGKLENIEGIGKKKYEEICEWCTNHMVAISLSATPPVEVLPEWTADEALEEIRLALAAAERVEQPEAEDFIDGVIETLLGIKNTIDGNSSFDTYNGPTPDQIRAIQNIRIGIGNWESKIATQ